MSKRAKASTLSWPKLRERKNPTARQRLYFQGFRLDFDKGRSLLSYNIKQDSKLQLVVEMEIFVTMLSAKTITLSVEAMHPVYTVMETIEYEEEIPLERQQLFFAGEILEDKRTLVLQHQGRSHTEPRAASRGL